MAERWRRLDISGETGKILAGNAAMLADLNAGQLMLGLGNDGKTLSPKISEDPFFKNAAAAKRYADWKHKLFPETPYDSPNLTVDGYKRGDIEVRVEGNMLKFSLTTPFAASAQSKYKGNHLGLSPDSKRTAWSNIVHTPLVAKIGALTGCKVQ